LRFDYVNTDRPVEGLDPVSEHTFNRILNGFLFPGETSEDTDSDSSKDSDEDEDEAGDV
jgi:hypothetical protein